MTISLSDLIVTIFCGRTCNVERVCVTIEGQMYTISAVTHPYQLRKGKYEPSDKRLDVLSTGKIHFEFIFGKFTRKILRLKFKFLHLSHRLA